MRRSWKGRTIEITQSGRALDFLPIYPTFVPVRPDDYVTCDSFSKG